MGKFGLKVPLGGFIETAEDDIPEVIERAFITYMRSKFNNSEITWIFDFCELLPATYMGKYAEQHEGDERITLRKYSREIPHALYGDADYENMSIKVFRDRMSEFGS